MFKSPTSYRYLGMKDLPQEFFFIENSAINVEILNIRKENITAGAYLVSITGIFKSDCQKIGTGALLIMNNYVLGLLCTEKTKLEGCQPQVQQSC